jgi:hypothetical protein
MQKGMSLFLTKGGLLVEVRFLMRQDPYKNPLNYKEELPQKSNKKRRSKVASNEATTFVNSIAPKRTSRYL